MLDDLIMPPLPSRPMPSLLSEQDIMSKLATLKGWRLEGDFLVRIFEFDDFAKGISFVNRVARVAERLQHHPDIMVRYTTVKLLIQTHSAGGITPKDFQLASAIERSLKRH